MRLHRFYVLQPLGEEVVIDDVSLVSQWTKVFRYAVGDFVILFNGDGNEYSYTLRTLSKKSCILHKEKTSSSWVPTKKTYLYLALIKKDLFELVVQKATELGVTDIVPIISTYTEKKNINTERLQTIIKEATEQSGRGTLLTLHKEETLLDACETLTKKGIPLEKTYVATLFGESLSGFLRTRISEAQGVDENIPTAFFVGPEGGWSPDEEELFKKINYTRISLGETVLRAETAGITCSFLSTVL